jgi:hypothetical protein
MVPITEDFDGYAPPIWVGPTVERLLGSLLPEHVIGLSSIVLTESAKTARVKTHRKGGRKFGPNQRLGLYRPAWRGEPPAIYLVVDNMLGQERPWLQFARDLTVGEVLYHEVGHHLSAKVGRIASNEEGSADAWRRKLWRAHVRKRYWFLRPMVPLIRLLYAVVLRLAQRSRRRRAAGHTHRV